MEESEQDLVLHIATYKFQKCHNSQNMQFCRLQMLSNTTPKVSLTVTRVKCILGIKKNDGNIDGMIKTQG